MNLKNNFEKSTQMNACISERKFKLLLDLNK